jgi:hypothetical protein
VKSGGSIQVKSGTLSRKAHNFYDLGEYKTALFLYERVTRISPKEYWGWIGKGLTYGELAD